MSDKSAHAKKRRPGCLGALFLWPFRGRWWVKALKLTFVAVILYNGIAFVFMWCPPVRGVVVDIDTGKPIRGAIVQKSASGPILTYSESPYGARTGGADAQMVTGPDGRFSFPGAFAHPTLKDTSAFDVYWPFQWLDSIDLSVWQRDYIGVSSFKIGMWWFRESPERSEGYCRVERYRIPFLGYRYRILLKKPATEAEWQVKIGSIDLGGGVKRDEQEQQRLFDDLTGYLERWPSTPYVKAKLPPFLDIYVRIGDSDNADHLDCRKLLAAKREDRDEYLKKFTFIGTWLESKLLDHGIAPESVLVPAKGKHTDIQKEDQVGWLVYDYQQWHRWDMEVSRCLGKNKNGKMGAGL